MAQPQHDRPSRLAPHMCEGGGSSYLDGGIAPIAETGRDSDCETPRSSPQSVEQGGPVGEPRPSLADPDHHRKEAEELEGRADELKPMPKRHDAIVSGRPAVTTGHVRHRSNIPSGDEW